MDKNMLILIVAGIVLLVAIVQAAQLSGFAARVRNLATGNAQATGNPAPAPLASSGGGTTHAAAGPNQVGGC